MKKAFILILTIFLIFAYKSFNKSNREDKVGVYYEIFVRSYADSNKDGIGDLKGIEAKVDEIARLGVEGVWLTPIFKSPSYHKYDVVDYYTIDEEYGNLEDLKSLVEKFHEKGIKVILDLVINHVSDKHVWFKNNKDFFVIKPNKDVKGLNGWHKLNDKEKYFGHFWSGMPDLNMENEELRKELHKIAKYWIKEANIDGYRLDAAMLVYSNDEYPNQKNLIDKNISWWKEFRSKIEKYKKDVYLVGEVWTSSDVVSKYYKVFDSNFNFDFSEKNIINMIIRENSSVMRNKLKRIYESYKDVNRNYIDAPMLTNHDQSRISESLTDLERQKLAASILLTMPGNPFIYYGEELGMRGRKPDEKIREAYIWKDKYQTNWQEMEYNNDTIDYYTQLKDENSLLNHYIKWIKIRNNNKTIKYGEYEPIDAKNDKIFAFKMKYKDEESIVLHNLSNEKQKFDKYTLEGYESKVINK